MKIGSLSCRALAVLLACGTAAPTALAEGPYNGYRIVTIDIKSQKDLLVASQFATSLACMPGPGPNEFLVAPDSFAVLEASGLDHVILVENAQAAIDQETETNAQVRADRGAGFFSTYRTLTEINTELDVLDALPMFPAEQVTKFAIGQSLEGRTTYALRISAPAIPGSPPKPTFLITAGQHAREWINVSSGMYIADRLARTYGVDPVVTQLLDSVEFVIVPVTNPDGYTHTFPVSQGGAGNRFWRKNRRDNGGGAFGVDTNRNWGHQWGGSGASTSPSSETYRGTGPFSEPETDNIRRLVEGGGALLGLPNLKAMIDLHSYSQLVLGPWGYTSANPPRLDEVGQMTTAQVNAITSRHGVPYIGGSAAQVLYLASGVAPDWAFGAKGALSWTYELRPIGGSGLSGFSIPPDQIIPTGEEAFAGITVLAQYIQNRLKISAVGMTDPLPLSGGGTATVTITGQNNYTLAAGTQKAFVRVGLTGAFSQVALTPTGAASTFETSLPSPPCGDPVQFYFEATANDGAVVRLPSDAPASALTVGGPACPDCLGDADGNRLVDFVDITAILSNWGNTGIAGPPLTIGDANYDGVVNFDDITESLAHWQANCP